MLTCKINRWDNYLTFITYDKYNLPLVIQSVIVVILRMFAQRSLRKPKFLLYFLPIGPFPDFIHEFKLAGMSLMELLGAFLK